MNVFHPSLQAHLFLRWAFFLALASLSQACTETSTSISCGEHGTASATDVCICDEGYTGDTCALCAPTFSSNAQGLCVPSCELLNCGAGTCSLGKDARAVCMCPDGYQGDFCDVCAPGFQQEGALCLRACDDVLCPQGYVCEFVASKGAMCTECASGYQDRDGDGVCERACAPDTCTKYGACQDDSGAAQCVCEPGYTGLSCGICAEGYQDHDGDGVCVPECEISGLMCPSPYACDDTSGTPECSACLQGYQDEDLDGRCLPDCTLAALSCVERAQCQIRNGFAQCVCEVGYDGVDCDMCAPGYQDHDGDGQCLPGCAVSQLLCPEGEGCVDEQGVALCVVLPQTCAEAGKEGYQTLYVNKDVSKPWDAWCEAGKAYLSLARTTGEDNVFERHGAQGWLSRTSYTRVALDEMTLEVDISDMRFAHTMFGTQDTTHRIPQYFGVATGCGLGSSGKGRINLEGTPFGVASSFDTFGSCAQGMVTTSGSHLVSLEGATGNCGSVGPGALALGTGDTCPTGGRVPVGVPNPVLPLAYVNEHAPRAGTWPSTCLEFKTQNNRRSDGEVTLYLGHDPTRPWTAYCADMHTQTPVAYLTLPEQKGGRNLFTTQSQDPSSAFNKGYEGKFTRIALDETTLLVDVTDIRYAISVDYEGLGRLARFGVVGGCSTAFQNGSYPGWGQIDLRGTPFEVRTEFGTWGTCATGSAVVSDVGQVVTLKGDGDCGFIGPEHLSLAQGDMCAARPPRFFTPTNRVLGLSYKR